MQVQTLECEKCKHEWLPRVYNPLKCPRCGHIRGTKVYKKAGEVAPDSLASPSANPTRKGRVSING